VPLTHVVDAVADHLRAAVQPVPTTIGAAVPAAASDLPAVTLSVRDASSPRPALGRAPGPPRTGALWVERTLDLADPVLRINGDETLLLSPDRLVVHLPHGAVVRADGASTPPFGPDDLTAALDGAPITIVTGAAPAAGQARLDPDRGTLTFATPLPATGLLGLGYHVGLWEVVAEHLVGELLIEAYGTDAGALDSLVRQVEAALAGPGAPATPGLRSLQPVAVGTAEAPDEDRFGARRQTLAFRFDFEREVAAIRSGGGVIDEVDVELAVEASQDGGVVHAEELFVVRPQGDPDE
jgi:hypothetical protein